MRSSVYPISANFRNGLGLQAVYQAGINSLQDKVPWINHSWIFKVTSEGLRRHFISIDCKRGGGSAPWKAISFSHACWDGLISPVWGCSEWSDAFCTPPYWDQYAVTRRRSGLCRRRSENSLITSATLKPRKSLIWCLKALTSSAASAEFTVMENDK